MEDIMSRWYITFLATLVISTNVMAQTISMNKYNFSDVDLRSELGPIRDQGDMGFCVSYATADMLSFWLKKYADINTVQPKNMVSGLGVAFVLNNEKREGMLYDIKEAKRTIAGDPQQVLTETQNKIDELNKKLSETPETTVATPEKKKMWGKLSEARHKAFLAKRLLNANEPEGELFNIPDKICFEKDIPSPPEQKDNNDPCNNKIQLQELFGGFYNLKIDSQNQKAITKQIQNLFPTIRTKYVKRLIKKFSRNPDFDAIHRLTDQSCKNLNDIMHKNYPSPRTMHLADEVIYDKGDIVANTMDEVFKVINERLDAGEPIGIGYDAALYYYPSPTIITNIYINHESTIVGRLYDTTSGEYIYIVRNTWGTDACSCLQRSYAMSLPSFRDDIIQDYCSNPVANQSRSYSDTAEKLYNANKEKYTSEIPFSCDKGYFLVKRSVLEQYIGNIDYYVPVEKLPKPEKQQKLKIKKKVKDPSATS